ncbi:MAG TPA: hypothetical protein VEL07_00820 [Planctomycetota bacterium]|nr:hypothetical protein [Planctomycetota bacterium]
MVTPDQDVAFSRTVGECQDVLRADDQSDEALALDASDRFGG